MSEVSGVNVGDINLAREIEGLRQLIDKGDSSALTLKRMLGLVETCLEGVARLEQRQLASDRDAEIVSHIAAGEGKLPVSMK